MTHDNPAKIRVGAFISGWMDPSVKPSTYFDGLLKRVAAAQRAGMSSVWVGEHLLGHPWPVLDTSVYAARLAGATGDMEIGAVYLLPLHQPVRLAEALVTLDNISGGRLVVCGTLGWRPVEYEAVGVPIKERVGRFSEVLAIMRMLWDADGPVNFDGRFYQLKNAHMVAKPERPGGIPVWLGASSLPAVKRAAKLGDSWLGSSHTPFDTLKELATAYSEELIVHGKKPQRRPLLRTCMVAPTDQMAEERFRDAFNAYYKIQAEWGIVKSVIGEENAGAQGEVTAGHAVVGSPETAVAQLKRYMELGFNEFIFQVGLPGTPEPFVLESMELLGKEVLPCLQGARVTIQ